MMRLVDIVKQDSGADFDQIALLRHFNSIERLLELGGSVEEFTYLQPAGTKWDFWADGKPPTRVVVAIVRDRVYAVYRVMGVIEEGTFESLASDALKHFDIERDLYKRERLTRHFRLTPINCRAVNAPITGWERREINSIIRSNAVLFERIQVILADGVLVTEEVVTHETLYEGSLCRVTVNVYERNPKAREKCIEAHGAVCAVCGFAFGAVYGSSAAGFIHVHHLKALSDIGNEYQVDPVVDLRPVCANCHAIIHLGGACRSIDDVRELVDPRVVAFWKSFT